MTRGAGTPRPALPRRRRFSPLTRRILAVNVLALAIVVGGLLYVDTYRKGLIGARRDALFTQAELIAVALSETTVARNGGPGRFEVAQARRILYRLVAPIETRARLFAADGSLLADSWRLPGGGMVEVEPLPAAEGPLAALAERLAAWLERLLPRDRTLAPYRERPEQRAGDYPEVVAALAGGRASALRTLEGHRLILSVAVPVQRFKRVLGALMLSAFSDDIDAAVREVRLVILQISAAALAVTVLLSLFLARTIARPVRRLAEAAEHVRLGAGDAIPDFSARNDEIGDLSRALREMTVALGERIDAIERFAADVAHEIKNPLTSLRSAVETAARVRDPAQQRQLMAIIGEDVQRLDRLISDISDASRLDAELARAGMAPVDIGAMLAVIVDVHRATGATPPLVLEAPPPGHLVVAGVEPRLVQVFENLIANARSFSPPEGEIWIAAARDDGWVVVTVDDQGPGIPPGKVEAIFERFYSERPAAEKFGTHSGLGLSISKHIVEAHGGTIRAENRGPDPARPEGARFLVRLPALQ